MRILVCKCGREIKITDPNAQSAVKCRCGRKYLYKRRSKHYVFAGFDDKS